MLYPKSKTVPLMIGGCCDEHPPFMIVVKNPRFSFLPTKFELHRPDNPNAEGMSLKAVYKTKLKFINLLKVIDILEKIEQKQKSKASKKQNPNTCSHHFVQSEAMDIECSPKCTNCGISLDELKFKGNA